MSDTFAYAIRCRRHYAGLTLEQLGRRMGIVHRPAQRVAQWERGYRVPGPASIMLLEAALDLPQGALTQEAKALKALLFYGKADVLDGKLSFLSENR